MDQKQLQDIRRKLVRQHEEAVCRNFLSSYNSRMGTTYKFVSLQMPPAPDALCSDGLNLEVTTAYLDQQTAKDFWDMVMAKETGEKVPFSPWHDCNDPEQTGFAAVDNCIAKKATLPYAYEGRFWLVVDIRTPLTEWNEIEADYLSQSRDVPAGRFEQTWLIMTYGDSHDIGEVPFALGEGG